MPMISCIDEEEESEGKSPELLKQVLFDYYDGIKNKDFDKMKGATSGSRGNMICLSNTTKAEQK